MADPQPEPADLSGPTFEERFNLFQSATFVAWVVGDTVHDRKGGVTFKLHVPFRYQRAAEGIWHANNVPLKITIERWTPE